MSEQITLESLCRQVEQESAAATPGPGKVPLNTRMRQGAWVIEKLVEPRVGQDKKAQLARARQKAREFLNEVCPECKDVPGDGRAAWGYCGTCKGKWWGGESPTTRTFAPKAAIWMPKMVAAIKELMEAIDEDVGTISAVSSKCARAWIKTEKLIAEFEQPKENA